MFSTSYTHDRPKLGTMLAAAAVALAASLTLAAPSMAQVQFPNQRVADLALSYPEGSWGGQCYGFVNTVLANASGGRIHIGGSHLYYGAYLREGGAQVSSDQAQRGDIIQISVPGNDNNYYNGMHTAIVIANLGGGNFDVVDSNWGYTERVHHHHLNPYRLVRSGESVQIWRMGQVPQQTPTQPPVTQPVTPPVQANSFHIYGLAPGLGVSVRSGPGVSFPSIGHLNQGDPVSILCQTQGGLAVGSTIWDEIGQGQYVSDWFVSTPVVNAFTPGLSKCAGAPPRMRSF